MNKRQFIRNVKELLSDMKDGYYGEVEFLDELWSWHHGQQERVKELESIFKKFNKKIL